MAATTAIRLAKRKLPFELPAECQLVFAANDRVCVNHIEYARQRRHGRTRLKKKQKRFNPIAMPAKAVRFGARLCDQAARGLYICMLNSDETQRLVFVMGCQRSGTSMLMRCFERDWRTKSYGERGLLDNEQRPDPSPYPDSDGLRIKSPEGIRRTIAGERAPILVAKALRESQHAAMLLRGVPESRVIWIYRGYRNVSLSHINTWGKGVAIRKLRPIFDGYAGPLWPSDNASKSTAEIVKAHYSPDVDPETAGVLLWYARNILFFELGLSEDPRVILCKYEGIVADPRKAMTAIYERLGFRYPGDKIIQHIHSRALHRGRDLAISREVEELCERLLERLESASE